MMKSLNAFLMAGMVAISGIAQAAIVTPLNPGGWTPQNVQGTGSVAITGTQAHLGNGSLEFGGTDGSAKADYQLNLTPFALSSLTNFSIDLYRGGASTVADHLAPAVRLLVDNGIVGGDRYSYLVWEPVYNGVAVVTEDTWTTYNLANANFWQRAFQASGNKTIEIFDRDLSEWLAPGTVTDGGGKTSNVVGPDAMVLQVQIGYGSGWTGVGTMFADNLIINDTSYNFEARAASAVPEPGSLALLGLGLAGLAAIRKRKQA